MRKLIFKILISYFIIWIVLSNVCYGYSSSEVGSAVAGFAEHILTSYSTSSYGGDGELQYSQEKREQNPFWSTSLESTYASTPWYFDCSSFATAVYNYVCGDVILGDASWPATTSSIESSSNFEDLGAYSASVAQPGDLICSSSHVEVFISVEKGTGGAHTSEGGVYLAGNGTISPSDGHIYRIKESVAQDITNLNTTYSGASISSTSSSVNLSDFYFNGIPDGQYSIASTNIFEEIIEALSTIADYIIGIITYGIRIVIVGWTALFDQIITNFVNELVGESVTSDGVSSVEIQSASNSERVTIENLVYNLYTPLNINIFK